MPDIDNTSGDQLELAIAKLSRTQREARVQELVAGARRAIEQSLESHFTHHEVASKALLFSGGNDSTVLAHLFRGLATHVRVLSGEWSRCLSESVTTRHGITGVFLDPPYGDEIEQTRVYATDSGAVSDDVRAWCIENGNNNLLKIALCGYDGEGHDALLDYGWTKQAWSAGGGYGGGRGGTGDANRHLERIYFSPACQPIDDGLLGLIDDGLAS